MSEGNGEMDSEFNRGDVDDTWLQAHPPQTSGKSPMLGTTWDPRRIHQARAVIDQTPLSLIVAPTRAFPGYLCQHNFVLNTSTKYIIKVGNHHPDCTRGFGRCKGTK